ncbi:MAG: hypothetical protein O7G88_14660 [bacterium]|nr:hypothetical protein [bacterium]
MHRMKAMISIFLLCIALSGCATTAERLASLDTLTGPVVQKEIIPLKTQGFASEFVTLSRPISTWIFGD